MTEQERVVGEVLASQVRAPGRPFVRLELWFRDGATYSRRWAVDDETAPAWRGAYAVSGPPAWAMISDPRPMRDTGAIIASELGKALVAAHGDVVAVDAGDQFHFRRTDGLVPACCATCLHAIVRGGQRVAHSGAGATSEKPSCRSTAVRGCATTPATATNCPRIAPRRSTSTNGSLRTRTVGCMSATSRNEHHERRTTGRQTLLATLAAQSLHPDTQPADAAAARRAARPARRHGDGRCPLPRGRGRSRPHRESAAWRPRA